MPDYAVTIAFKGKDGVTQKFKLMGAEASRFSKRGAAAFQKVNAAGLTFKKTLGAILGAQVIGRGAMYAQMAIRGVVEEFVTFDDAITRAGAKFPTAVVRGSKEFDRLREVARKVGAETKFSATEAAEGLDFLAMAGFNAEQAMAALPQVTNLAVVAGGDLARATDIASDALGSFGMMTKDSTQLTANLTRINDVFARTITSANTDMEMLYETMKDGGPVMTASGASIETFAALTGMMANAGIKGTKAGTTLKNMFLNLQAPVPKAAKLMKQLGLELIDKEGKLRDITEILGDFNRATAKMGKAQKAAAVDTIFGKRAIAGVSVLLAEGENKMKAYRQTLIDAGGSADEMAKTIEQSLGNRLKALRSAAIELGFKFIDAFEKKIPGAIDGAIEAVRTFNVKPVIEGFKTFVKWIGRAWSVLKMLEPVLVGLVAAKVAYVAITKTMVAIEAVQFFFGLVKALRAATGAQAALNVVMAANPIGLTVVAIGLLVAAIWYLWRNWDTITENWQFTIDALKIAFGAMKDSFVKMGDDIAAKWEKLKVYFKDAWDGFKMSGKEAIDGVKNFFIGLWDKIKALFFDKISLSISDTIGKFKKILRYVPGFGGEVAGEGKPSRETEARTAPNAAEAAAQNIRFQGKLTVAGAPPGSTIESKTIGAPPVRMELAGANI